MLLSFFLFYGGKLLRNEIYGMNAILPLPLPNHPHPYIYSKRKLTLSSIHPAPIPHHDHNEDALAGQMKKERRGIAPS